MKTFYVLLPLQKIQNKIQSRRNEESFRFFDGFLGSTKISIPPTIEFSPEKSCQLLLWAKVLSLEKVSFQRHCHAADNRICKRKIYFFKSSLKKTGQILGKISHCAKETFLISINDIICNFFPGNI